MIKHFITFYSPGTFFSETTQKEIDNWSIDKAKELAYTMYPIPYGFRFSTVEKTGSGWNVITTIKAKSAMYFLGGQIKTLADIEAENDPKNKILISNMKGNGWDKVVVNTNSWKVTQPFEKDDLVVNFTPSERK